MKRLKPKHRIVLLAFALLAMGAWYLFLYEPTYSGLVKTMPEKPLVFAHRGFGNGAPDNSLAGAVLAMNSHMDGVDVDGQFTKDGELVIFHDLSVDRLTTSTGRVNDKALEELKKLDLAAKFGKGFKGAYVATFEEFLKQTKGKGILMAELKVTGLKDTGIEKKAVEIITKYDAFENVYLSSFNPFVLHRLKKLDPRIRTVMIFMDTNWNAELLAEIKPEDKVSLPWFLRQEWIRRGIRKIIKPDLLSVNHKVDERTIARVQAAGYPIFLWTPDTEAEIQSALAHNPYGVISDEPLVTKKLRDALP